MNRRNCIKEVLLYDNDYGGWLAVCTSSFIHADEEYGKQEAEDNDRMQQEKRGFDIKE